MAKYEQTSENGSGDGGGDIIREGSETVSETYKILQQNVVHYKISIDGQTSRVMTIKVKNEDYIDSIIDEIKTKNGVLLSSVDPAQIELFESIEEGEPLNALKTWNPSVSWGTKLQPLMVKVNTSMVAVGKCIFIFQ